MGQDRMQELYDEIKTIRATAEARCAEIQRAAQEKVAKKLSEMASLLCGSEPPKRSRKPKEEKPATPAESKPRGARADGLPAKILAKLAGNPTMQFTADEMIGELGLGASDKAHQVRSTLSRMLKQGKIASPSKGQYQDKAA